MKILQTLLIVPFVVSSHLLYEVCTHNQPLNMTATFSFGQDHSSIAASQAVEDKGGFIGLMISKNVIQRVFPGSPAEQAGLCVGDKVLEINDKSIFGLTASGISHQLKGKIGTSVDIILERGDELRKLCVTRAAAVPEEAAISVNCQDSKLESAVKNE